MQTKTITAVMLAVAMGIFGSVNGALALPVVWQIGQPDEDVARAYMGALEYPATGAFDIVFDYAVDPGNPIDDASPLFPGYLGPMNVIDIANDGRPPTDTTNMVNITFDLGFRSSATELIYSRYGSESDVLWLDGDLIAITDIGTELAFQQYTFDLGSLSQGDHTITLAYWGGGAVNGHYIDAIQLTAIPNPEPGTILLLGTGLVGLVGWRKKFRLK